MPRTIRISCLCLCLCLAAGFAPADDAAKGMKKLTLDLMLEWESAGNPVLSPDGTQIIYTRTWANPINDRQQRELWIMNADGSRPRFLAEGSGVRFSPDGTRIAFLAPGKPQGTQIHVMWLDTRETTQITRVTESPGGLRWSPDGRSIAFTMLVPEKQDFKISLPPRPTGAKWAPDPTIITRLSYRRDRQGYRPRGFQHLFVVDATGGTPRQVTDGDYDHRGGEWTPDGRHLVFSGLRVPDADWQVEESEVYRVAVATGEVETLTDRVGPDGNPVVSPDGKYIAYTGHDKNDDTYDIDQLHFLNLADGSRRVVGADLNRQLRGLFWAPDSQALYFTVSSEGAYNLYRATLDGTVSAVTTGAHRFVAEDVSRNGLVAGTLATAHQPGDIVTLQLDSPETFNRLTRVNDDILAGVTLGEVEEIWYDSVDGYRVQGWIIKPPDFDPANKYPLILQIHGGPHAMYGGEFNFERQNHAAEGFVVLYTNPRGSVGYGKTFGNAINNAYPDKDYDDLMRGVDDVIARGYIDEQKLYVYGGSGGGVLTAWIVGHTDRFTAAVSMFPVINWISFVGTTDGPYWYHNFKQLPWEDITEHWERSPLKYAGNVTTPTLLITGELDLRTPMAQTEEFYQALKLRKVDTAMIRIPDEYHGAAGRHLSNTLRRILYVRKWFTDHMPPGKPAPEN
ncbi:MAG: S9 family peptidase [Acidobacteria bacterium]|nr:S9 family peptidase [Acidobacteriota bacterium]